MVIPPPPGPPEDVPSSKAASKQAVERGSQVTPDSPLRNTNIVRNSSAIHSVRHEERNRPVSEARPRDFGVDVRSQRMPMPERLETTSVEGKRNWTVDTLLGDDIQSLRNALRHLIPDHRDRIQRDLNYKDCTNPHEMPEGYDTYPAKTENRDGIIIIYINNSFDDYFNADGAPNTDRIRSTICHEFVHAVSAKGTGLQDYSDFMGNSALHSPDEAITDYFSVEVYQRAFGRDTAYITNYWVPIELGLDAGKLPVMWLGRMAEFFIDVLDINRQILKEIYFNDPGNFGIRTQGQQDLIIKNWTLLLGKECWLNYQERFSTKYINIVRDVVIKEVIPEVKNWQELSIKDRRAAVEERLRSRSIPPEIMQGSWVN